ncbi:tetratricopeptide repeat protein [Streptomyces sp. NBC_00005]|uniref:tetratricopeptide repeat protein n=1 Tax=Streptomyces sp. NBC_00005 TaxID=2903609 RepID=UPI0032497B72
MAPRTNDTEPEKESGGTPLTAPDPEVAQAAEEAGDTPGRAAPEPEPSTTTGDTGPDAGARTTTARGPVDSPAQGPSTGAAPRETDTEDTTPATATAPTTVPRQTTGDPGDGPAEGPSSGSRSGRAGEPVADVASRAAAAEGTAEEKPSRPGGRTHPESASDDQRVAAVRRVGAAGRRLRGLQLGGTVVLLAIALTSGSIAVGALRDGGTTVASAPSAMSPALLSSGSLDASIVSLQAQLRAQPKDFGSWATLGLAYVEQARTKGDPSRYPQAEKALKRSLDLKPGNEQAVTGQAALAAARHDFTDALKYADQVLKEIPYSQNALSSRIDALVELGRYAEASKAADTADSRRPGVPVFTRYAYVHELRGDVKTARRVLEQALDTSSTPGDISYVAAQLGQLAWNQGDYKSALTYYARALAADENYLPALEGRARAQYASGDRAGAIKGMEQVVARYPLPQPLVELGELYEDRGADGDKAKARDQYALVDAWIALARANGVNADLDTALAAADHGDKASALRAARAEWARRHTVHTADALAWALHVNGKDEEALPYARRATATGYRNASFLYHRGMIERATGHEKDARTWLKAALKLNPGFSPLGAGEARKALKDLGAAK